MDHSGYVAKYLKLLFNYQNHAYHVYLSLMLYVYVYIYIYYAAMQGCIVYV